MRGNMIITERVGFCFFSFLLSVITPPQIYEIRSTLFIEITEKEGERERERERESKATQGNATNQAAA